MDQSNLSSTSKEKILSVGDTLLDRQGQTVFDHTPLLRQGKATQEVWSTMRVMFVADGGPCTLQSGQFIPVWRSGRVGWEKLTPVQVATHTALVYKGRIMINGGGDIVSEHPTITDWAKAAPYLPQNSDAILRHPGGLRRLKPSNSVPTLMSGSTDPSSFSFKMLTAPHFVSAIGGATADFALTEVYPISIVASEFGEVLTEAYTPVSTFDVLQNKVITAVEIPLPVILSDLENKVLHAEPADWSRSILDFCKMFEITEVGIKYTSPHGILSTVISELVPSDVFRAPKAPDSELGIPALDYRLLERMMPFTGGDLDADFIV